MTRALRPLLVVGLGLACGFACRRDGPKNGSAGDAAAPSSAFASSSTSFTGVSSSDLLTAREASDRREAAAVPSSLASSSDVVARRASARALAQIGDKTAVERLGHALSDEDPEVVGWAAYGIALRCDVEPDLGREERAQIVHALAARALTWETHGGTSGVLEPWSALAWGLGRCGGIDASRELARWLRGDVVRARAACFALGAIAQHDRGLEDDIAQLLVEAARGGEAGPMLPEALYPFGRGDWSGRPPAPGLGEVARAHLGGDAQARLFAIRALGREDAGKPADLRPVLADATSPPERLVEAIRALHKQGVEGDAEIAAFATREVPTTLTAAAWVTPHFGPLRVALELLAERPATKTVTSSLRAFLPTGFAPIAVGIDPVVARRVASLRCLAAVGLHPSAPADSELVRCAAHDAGLPAALGAELDALRDDARLTTLDHTQIVDERRELLLRLAKDGALRVRERALSILAKHAETEAASAILVRALGAKELGWVAAAAQALTERPSLADHDLALSPKEQIKQGMDPKAPGPATLEPKKGVDPAVEKALEGVLARSFEEADAEIEIDLAGAVGALRFAKGRAFLLRLCGHRGPALRRAARQALDHLDPPGTAHACDVVTDFGAAASLAAASPKGHVLTLETDVGALTLTLDPTYAPLAVARVAELAAAGFYDGIVFHRVVPGFVVQFGDPLGDGYGGAHQALRCETAPIAFEPLSIGVALAGRDTGSSQLFVTLARTPHLEGSYSWLGKASGPFAALAEGDVVTKVKVD